MQLKSRVVSVILKGVMVVLVSLFSVFYVQNAEAAWMAGKLEIYLFDVGQADSQFIVSPTGKTILIDVGERNWNGSGNAVSVANKIHQIMGANFTHIDYIVASHLHTDHIGTAGYGTKAGYGGIWNIIEKQGFTVGKLIDRDSGVWVDSNHDGVCDPASEIVWHNIGTESGTAGKWLCYVTDPANANKLHREIPIPGSTSQIDLGPEVMVKIIESDAKNAKMVDGVTLVAGDHSNDSKPPSENDYSITFKITYHNFTYVTGGDTDGEYATSTFTPQYVYDDIESMIAPSIGKVDVMKVNHHGSGHSSNQTYISTLHPAVAMISCGSTNTYGHPDQTTLDRLLANGKVYLTEKCDPSRNYRSSVLVNGDIVVSTSDGTSYTVNGDLYTSTTSTQLHHDTTSPTVTAFKVVVTQSTFTTQKVKVTAFSASDGDSAVTGYKITETPTIPVPGSTGWTTSHPTLYKIKSTSTRALYGWAKDAAGNVSQGRQAEVWFER